MHKMNYMLQSVLLMALFFAGVLAVHPDYILSRVWQHNSNEPAPTTEMTNGGFELSANAVNLLCCKLGERVGNRRLHCSMELFITFRNDNTVFKHKQKLYHDYTTDAFTRRRNSNYLFGSLQDLNRCANHKKIFEKCCVHRRNNLERTDFLDITFDVPGNI